MIRLTPVAAAVVALSLNIAAATASEASAQPRGETHTSEIQVAFSYNPAAQPDDIYASLKRKAERACRTHGFRPLSVIETDRACADDLLNSAVARVGRADVAAFHRSTPIKLAGS